MKKNPKIIAGAAALVLLLGGFVYMLTRDIPLIGEVRREMSLTPTPLPPVPEGILADPFPDLAENSWGLDVEDVQRRLRELGYIENLADIDGQFGPKTKSAVIAFQEANGLPASGVVDKATREALNSPGAKPKQ